MNIQRAVIVTHGLQRNAGDYFVAVANALHNDTDPTLVVIAPHFKGYVPNTSCNDALEDFELHWSCNGTDAFNRIHRWDDGGQAHDTNEEVVYSFSMIDRLLQLLDNNELFPNLTKITITGHSDGGQFTQRYATGNQLDGTINASVKYVIANPGSYMYLDNRRLPRGETCFECGRCTSEFIVNWDPLRTCPRTYNNYKYGLQARDFGYMRSDQPGFTDDDLRGRFTSRLVAYLLGEADQRNNAQFDTSCPATAQGSHLQDDGTGLIGGRRERGTIFWNYIRQLGADHSLTIVPTCGHDEFCIYRSQEMVDALLF